MQNILRMYNLQEIFAYIMNCFRGSHAWCLDPMARLPRRRLLRARKLQPHIPEATERRDIQPPDGAE